MFLSSVQRHLDRPVVHHFINVLMHIVVLVELVLDGHWTAFHIARSVAEVWSSSVHLFHASLPDLVRYCFTVSSLAHRVLENHSLHFTCKKWNLLIASFVHGQLILRSVRYTAVHTGYHSFTFHLQRHGLRLVDMRITSHRSVKFS